MVVDRRGDNGAGFAQRREICWSFLQQTGDTLPNRIGQYRDVSTGTPSVSKSNVAFCICTLESLHFES
jgi:hypothetical protein